MSRRKAKDYKAIFRGLLRNLSRVPSVEKMVADFEKAAWKAVKTVFPDVEVQGCVFHWTQAVWRQIQKRGLAGAYKDDRATRKYLGKLMALPFLPKEQIPEAYEKLAEKATHDLVPLVDYIRTTWIESNVWQPASWSIFGQSVRTNNDVEGWHRRFNEKAKALPTKKVCKSSRKDF
eukprot:gene21298-biopygen16333